MHHHNPHQWPAKIPKRNRALQVSLGSLALAISIAHAETYSLATLLERTQNHHPDLLFAQAQISEAKAQKAKALSYALPKLSMSLTAARTDDALQSFGMQVMQRQASFADFGAGEFNPANGPSALAVQPKTLNYPDDHTDYGSALQVEVPLWTGGKLQSARQMAQAGHQAALHQKTWKTQEVSMEVLANFAKFKAANAYVQVAMRAESTYVELNRMLQGMHREGMIPKSDLMAAQLKSQDAQLLKQQALDQSADAQTQLLLLAGLDPHKDQIQNSETPLNPVQQECTQTLAQNPAIQAARSMGSVASHNTKMAHAGWYPTFGAMAKLEAHNPDSPQIEAWSYTLGVKAEWALFEGGRTQAEIAEAKAKERQWLATIQKAESQMLRSCLDQNRQILTAQKKLNLQESALQQSLEMRRLVEGRLKTGLAPLVEWFGAQTQVEKAEADRIAAQQELWMQIAASRMLAGQLQ